MSILDVGNTHTVGGQPPGGLDFITSPRNAYRERVELLSVVAQGEPVYTRCAGFPSPVAILGAPASDLSSSDGPLISKCVLMNSSYMAS